KDLDMKYGIVTINEVRSERGLPPVPWGNTPWLPINQAPTDFVPDRSLVAPRRGRNYDPGKVGEGR
ncbi:hypothetical protein ACTUM2_15330, partial [Listeria monocytogenes]|uniref:hypothetical protein n=1 Tax=Listeria monocytogenes TaxID=1639 RepID=UPI003FA43153